MQNQVVVVTGSSTGIGKAIAIRFAELGARIVLHGRSESQSLLETMDSVRNLGAECEAVYADFENSECLDRLVTDAWSKFETVDCWINNAGGDVLTGRWADAELYKKLDYLFEVDVKSTWKLSRSVGQKMGQQSSCDERDRSIINIGWDQAWQGMAGDSGEMFSITKGSIMAVTKSLAQSLAPLIRVNCIAPGWIQTSWGEQTSEYWDRRAKSESLMNRWGRPEDIAGVATFLASRSASFVNGQVIAVNGGFRLHQS
ncbi:MAG: SDR family oxidoreductase [Planctomycetota bacterium]